MIHLPIITPDTFRLPEYIRTKSVRYNIDRTIYLTNMHVYFANGYGGSVSFGTATYGGSNGLFEVAVIGPDDHLSYDTPITDDVVGWLDADEVAEIMERIAALPKIN